MKKIVVAADSFKGSLSSARVACSVECGIRQVFPLCDVRKLLVADGGEGTLDAICTNLGGRYTTVVVSNPILKPVEARYGIIGNGTAVVELSAASGLTLVPTYRRNPMKTTTYGTGELIADALRQGCRKFLICIGGSATNDGGMGLLRALGFRFIDHNDKELSGTGADLARLDRIDDSSVLQAVRESDFTVACDVQNPLYGVNGAAYVFAPQKGATPQQVKALDDGLRNYAEVIRGFNGCDVNAVNGAGAAGGVGGGLAALLGAKLVSGIDMVLDAVGFDDEIRDADLIITGEGKLDSQTAFGKAPRGVLLRARRAGVPVIAVGGAVEDADVLNREGFTAAFPVVNAPMPLESAMDADVASANIERTVRQIMQIIKMKIV